MIPQCGVESAPADLLSWSLVSYVRQALSTGTAELIMSIHDFIATPSGGTLATIFALFDTYSLTQIAKSSEPYCLCPVAVPTGRAGKPLIEKVTGTRSVSDLGTLTTSLQGGPDATIVNRSWGLIEGGKYYGSNFRFSPYMRARNVLIGFAVHLAITFGVLLLIIPPVRWYLKNAVYQPGTGPSKEYVSIAASQGMFTYNHIGRSRTIMWSGVP